MAFDKAALLTERFGIESVPIPGVGEVKVRGLSRSEALKLRGVELDADEMERRLLSLAMVDPKMTADEVGQWQASSPAGELEPVVEVVIRLSGMEKAAAKAAFTEFRN